jgi:hypothetical protein
VDKHLNIKSCSVLGNASYWYAFVVPAGGSSPNRLVPMAYCDFQSASQDHVHGSTRWGNCECISACPYTWTIASIREVTDHGSRTRNPHRLSLARRCGCLLCRFLLHLSRHLGYHIVHFDSNQFNTEASSSLRPFLTGPFIFLSIMWNRAGELTHQ